MTRESSGNGRPWQELHGPNLAYIIEQYEKYREDPEAVDPAWKDRFERWGPPLTDREGEIGRPLLNGSAAIDVKKAVAAEKLVQNIRTYGHLAAKIDPLEDPSHRNARLIDPKEYGLSEEDLKAIPAEVVWPEATGDVRTARDVVKKLCSIYTETLAFEFSHVHEPEEREWLYRTVESGVIRPRWSTEKRVAVLNRLIEVEGFEKFLNRTFVGQKRFSIEGLDIMVPMLDEIIQLSVHGGVKNIMIGMAHRGRLNVLAHVLGKPYETIFSEFHHAPDKELVPSEGSMGINYGWTGDVKYHLGADRELDEGEALHARLTLAHNPSHLEFVNPVVEGYTRAAQDDREKPGYPRQDVSRALAILIHGDAAFPGEGIVAETLNLSRLSGYRTGGTIHIIANNKLGFTTTITDARSTMYASDLAKGFEIPVVRVNADDPEACLAAVNLAHRYRSRFQKDFLIDLIGYRRFGHNEMDDPSTTQPRLYARIQQHPSVSKQFADRLVSEGAVSQEYLEKKEQEVQKRLREAHRMMKESRRREWEEEMLQRGALSGEITEVKTGVPVKTLREINEDLLKTPEGFTVYPKLERVLRRRAAAFDGEGKVDWALAEILAFATILMDGTAIRLTGQDTERGTFAHRHLVLHDPKTGESYCPLHIIPQARASFAIHNSPLSEASVLGFEYGYNVFSPETLVLWEAQYGDFANVAQVIIDQFLSAGRAKWSQKSSLVLLLPHGYEGQGPEHSSARLERFLQLSAENNWVVANLTSAAQYFHILRRQAALTDKKEARPLVLMTPKSLIRNRRTASPASEFEEGRFRAVREQAGTGQNAERVERLILCSGKIGVDLEEELESGDHGARDWLHILRVEQLYPFPEKEIRDILRRFPRLKEAVWVQEEPRNMGAWSYMEPRIRAVVPEPVEVRYIGRPEHSSPAEGLPDFHHVEQRRILNEALSRKATDITSNRGGNDRD